MCILHIYTRADANALNVGNITQSNDGRTSLTQKKDRKIDNLEVQNCYP